jgi:ribosomal protein L31E
MGRQHTTWISDETWNELQNIGGDSVSKKIRNAVAMANPEREMVIKAKLRQLERAKEALKIINQLIVKQQGEDLHWIVNSIANEIDEVWWMVEE